MNWFRLTSPYSRLAVFQLGGAIQRYDEQAMAVSHRNVKYVIAINTGWDDPKATEKQIQWTRDLWTAVRPFSSGGVYVNFLSNDDGEDRVLAAYGATKFERLVQLKSRFDPNNLFQMNQNINPVLKSLPDKKHKVQGKPLKKYKNHLLPVVVTHRG